MYVPQYPEPMHGPPPYQNNMQLPNYCRPAEERMIDFQELVGRYESKFEKKFNV
jgi:hypothetical protein